MSTLSFQSWSFFVSHKTISVLIMLTVFSSIFSSSAQAGKIKLHARQVNLSGNVFHFSIPEDFSKDMPAADMVETLDISDLQKFDNQEYGNLMRRWWDIKNPGWFGKELGTVMMDIAVQKSVKNERKFIHDRDYDIKDRMDFMLMLDDAFHQRYDQLNKEMEPEKGRSLAYASGLMTLSGTNIYSLYHDKILNGQRWINYSIAAPQGVVIVLFSLPISEKIYLEISFTYSPNHGVSPRELGDVAHLKMLGVEESFYMKFNKDNHFDKIVGEDWLNQTNTEVLEQHRDLILKVFYGSDPEAAILKMEREEVESRKKHEQEAREGLHHDPH